MLRSDTVLTAQWRAAEEFTVTYVNGETVVAEAEGLEASEFEITQPDPADTYTREFVGWSDGEGTYVLGDSFVLTGDVTLTAQWRDFDFHDVTFVSEGKTVATETVREDGTLTIDVDPGTRDGHEFSGWSLSDGGEVAYTTGSALSPTGDMTLHAVWTAVTAEPDPPDAEDPPDGDDTPAGSDDEDKDDDTPSGGDDGPDDSQEPSDPSGPSTDPGGGTWNPGPWTRHPEATAARRTPRCLAETMEPMIRRTLTTEVATATSRNLRTPGRPAKTPGTAQA